MEQKPETLGSRLRQLRNARGLTQEAVADQLGIGRGYLSEVENDNVKSLGSENLTKFVNFFGVSADYLLHGKNQVEHASEPKPVYTCEIKFVLPDPSNELIENLNLFRDVLEHGAPQHKEWLEGQIKWDAWKLKNW